MNEWQWVFNMGDRLSAEDKEGRHLPKTVEEVDTFDMVWFVKFMSTQPHADFMKAYPSITSTDLSPDEFHDMQLKYKLIMKKNEQIRITSFEEDENPERPQDPMNKEIEHMTPENKQLILENDNSTLIDCAVQWMMMLNEDLQGKIVQRISTVTKKKEADDQDGQDVSKDPVAPPAKMVSSETQTAVPEKSEKTGSSHKREEPSSSVNSQQRQQKRKRKTSVLMVLLLRNL